MDSLVGYGSDDDYENDRYGRHHSSVSLSANAPRKKEDDTNYDDVNMDMSEESGESEPELPPAEAASRQPARDRRYTETRTSSRERDRDRDDKKRDERDDRDDKKRDVRDDKKRDDRRRDEKYSSRSERDRREGSSRRGLLGDKPDDRSDTKMPSLMDVRAFDDAPGSAGRSHDAGDAVSPRFVDRDRRDRDRERERDRDKHSRRSEEKRSGRDRHSDRSRSREFRETRDYGKTRNYPPPELPSSSTERRISPPAVCRPTSYKVNKKLEVMEKMGLQIKTPDGSMATAQQLRQAASEAPAATSRGLPSYYNPTAVNTNKILDQVQKRKLLWSGKNKSEAEEASKWSGTRFAQDNDGKQVSKFMRLMGIKEPAAVKPEAPDRTADPIKKQEELFQAMQQQYEVARATTHTMRGVGLGFQRGQF